MKHQVKKFKSLKVALKELEPFIKNGAHLRTGKSFAQLGGLRSREILANWLICVVLNNEVQKDQYEFTSDPNGGDGVIVETASGHTWETEHVMVPPENYSVGVKEDVTERIIQSIKSKQNKGGAQYASGKQLIVFIESNSGEWNPNRIVSLLPVPLDFDDVWAVGLQKVEAEEYTYAVTQLDVTSGNAPTWLIRVGADFNSWTVQRIQ
jgi:hypothetical protein